MNRRLKLAAAGTVLVVFVGAGTALAVSGGTSAAPTTTTTSVEPPTEVLAEQIEQIAPEVIAEPEAPAAPAGLPEAEVRAAQEKLISMGYWMSGVDGKVGSVTSQAVLAFQKVNGMARTAKLDAGVAEAIAKASRPAAGAGGPDHIEIDKSRQVIFVVRGGEVQWVFNTSTGTERSYVTNGHRGFAHTPTGNFAVNRVINGVDKGPLGDLYRPRYFTNNGIAVHGSASIPAYGASHGCARVHNAVMDFIWANNLMPVGGKVWVYDRPGSPAFSGAITPTPATTAPPSPEPTQPPTTPAPTTTTPPPPAPEPTTTVAPESTTTTTTVLSPG